MTSENDIWNIMSGLKEELNDTKEVKDRINCNCGSSKVIIEDTMQICGDCFAIIGKVINTTSEWRFYGNDDNKNSDPSRCGLPTNDLLPKSSLGSVIGGNRRDNNIDIRRIRMYQIWNSMPYDERTLWNVFDKLSVISLTNGIPQIVIDDAKVLYKKAAEKKISRGDNKDGLIASCLYHSCLLNNIPRSAKEIAKMFEINPIVLNKGNSRFQNLLQINVNSSSPIEFISRYCTQLNMKIEDIAKCKKLVVFLEDNEIMNDNAPTSSCASILYYYSQKMNLGFTKKEFAKICDVSEVTVIKGYKNICKFDNFIDKHKESLF